jgi:hypothetical protein
LPLEKPRGETAAFDHDAFEAVVAVEHCVSGREVVL